jgi:hypothetical protein
MGVSIESGARTNQQRNTPSKSSISSAARASKAKKGGRGLCSCPSTKKSPSKRWTVSSSSSSSRKGFKTNIASSLYSNTAMEGTCSNTFPKKIAAWMRKKPFQLSNKYAWGSLYFFLYIVILPEKYHSSRYET